MKDKKIQKNVKSTKTNDNKLQNVLIVCGMLFLICSFSLWAINTGVFKNMAEKSETPTESLEEQTENLVEGNLQDVIKNNDDKKIVRMALCIKDNKYTANMEATANKDINMEIIPTEVNGIHYSFKGEAKQVYYDKFLSYTFYQDEIIATKDFTTDFKATLKIGDKEETGVVTITGTGASITFIFVAGQSETMGYISDSANKLEKGTMTETTSQAEPSTVAETVAETVPPTTVAQTEPSTVETVPATVAPTTPPTVAETVPPTTIAPPTIAETVPPTTVVIPTAPPTVAEEPKMETRTVVVPTAVAQSPETEPATVAPTAPPTTEKETKNSASGIQADLGGFGTPMTEPQTTKSIQNIEGFDGNSGNSEELDEKDQEKINGVLNDFKNLGF